MGEGMRILITGGAGFIGSSLCDLLVGSHHVFCLDNFSSDYAPDIKRKNLDGLRNNERFTILEGDLRNKNFLDEVFLDRDIDMVVHLAAKAGVRSAITEDNFYIENNVMGTMNLLESMVKYGVKKLIFSSSSSVYGSKARLPFTENSLIEGQDSVYARTKFTCEQMIANYQRNFALSAVILRFFCVYGPRQRPNLAIYRFVEAINKDEPLTVFGRGELSRDFTYISDILDGLLHSIDYLSHRNKSGVDVFNLGTSFPVKINDLIKHIERMIGKRATIEYLDKHSADLLTTQADISKARSVLGYNPSVQIDEGLAKFWSWYKERGGDD